MTATPGVVFFRFPYFLYVLLFLLRCAHVARVERMTDKSEFPQVDGIVGMGNLQL